MQVKISPSMLAKRGLNNIEIEVDGNVSFENAVKMREAGADIFVAGTSSLFTNKMPMDATIAKFREIIK